MPILRFLNVCICTVLKRLRTEEHCRPMADKIKWIGWRTPIGRHVIPACVPIGRACFVSTHFTEGASQNFVQKGFFSWAEFLEIWKDRTLASDRNGHMRSWQSWQLSLKSYKCHVARPSWVLRDTHYQISWRNVHWDETMTTQCKHRDQDQ